MGKGPTIDIGAASLQRLFQGAKGSLDHGLLPPLRASSRSGLMGKGPTVDIRAANYQRTPESKGLTFGPSRTTSLKVSSALGN